MSGTDYIRVLIEKNGPITVADYMQLALQHPEFGYYRCGDPLGHDGDFITAPEISQMFGEMIGLWCAEAWRQMGNPAEFVFLEMGPGRGTLMQDALRATEKIAGFHAAMRLYLLESNETLRKMQVEKLAPYKPVYIDDLALPSEHLFRLQEGQGVGREFASLRNVSNSESSRETSTSGPPLTPPTRGRGIQTAASLPPLPIIAITNEFFDALPIRQFEKTFNGWCERMVGFADDAFYFTHSPPDDAFKLLMPEALREALPGTYYEFSPAVARIMKDLAKRVAQNRGAALVVDYGYAESDGRPTLQAVSGHGYTEVLRNPGAADITALVDFSLLKRAAVTQGAVPYGPIGQGEFLQTLGIELRADLLKRHATPKQARDIDTALARLTDPAAMGALFKVLAVASPLLTELPGF